MYKLNNLVQYFRDYGWSDVKIDQLLTNHSEFFAYLRTLSGEYETFKDNYSEDEWNNISSFINTVEIESPEYWKFIISLMNQNRTSLIAGQLTIQDFIENTIVRYNNQENTFDLLLNTDVIDLPGVPLVTYKIDHNTKDGYFISDATVFIKPIDGDYYDFAEQLLTLTVNSDFPFNSYIIMTGNYPGLKRSELIDLIGESTIINKTQIALYAEDLVTDAGWKFHKLMTVSPEKITKSLNSIGIMLVEKLPDNAGYIFDTRHAKF